MSPVGAFRSFHLRSIILRKGEVIVASAFLLQLLQSIFLFTYYTLIITIGRTMKYLLRLKGLLTMEFLSLMSCPIICNLYCPIIIYNNMSYYICKDHSFSLELNNTGKLKYQENACKYLVPMKSPSPLHALLPCCSNLREVLSTKMLKAGSV